MQRYFLNDNVNTTFTLDDETYHHFVTVLRAKEGTKAEFVQPNQTVVIASLATVVDGMATMNVVDTLTSNVELPVDTTIVCGLPKGDKAELIVQKATELGVNQVIFVQTAWSVAKWNDKAAKKIARLQKIAAGAAEQSHRTRVPVINYLASLTDVTALAFDHKMIAYEEAAKTGEQAQLAQTLARIEPQQSICAVFGPEGGIAPQEIEKLTANGYVVTALGPRILRAETAPLYWLSAISFALELAQPQQ
ncbi:16S rRNA (uracil(1498)-N(3))-methyltransferase [Periweissella fabaria]|uniref:Ribosomal RNA small subunit methyltransferase E n=1 Tax=Periweissella fabaria TaxID=546157 RepID=A0ABM8Z4R5_9LACO|nr:16S rRNA (uracil(1498)-N(3))-methyltransferase [Periweissella fabaria]MCM0596441.1 16S rRNA (uracil(1498)-N(3))-methyltransferase [Periweissella fabaria]CAH0415832.1 Ribosomal RNA small subunit methyltransferase E [Periweissella fabaria]